MKPKRTVFVVVLCFLLMGLFAFNSYADEATIDWKGGNYTGEVVGGVPHGQGSWTHSDGRKYVGEYKKGLPNGRGTAIWSVGKNMSGNGLT